MAEIAFVKNEHFEMAHRIENKIINLSSECGIVFVGVDVSPTTKDLDPVYHLSVGVERGSGLDQAVAHLVTLTLSEELLAGANIKTEVIRGITRG